MARNNGLPPNRLALQAMRRELQKKSSGFPDWFQPQPMKLDEDECKKFEQLIGDGSQLRNVENTLSKITPHIGGGRSIDEPLEFGMRLFFLLTTDPATVRLSKATSAELKSEISQCHASVRKLQNTINRYKLNELIVVSTEDLESLAIKIESCLTPDTDGRPSRSDSRLSIKVESIYHLFRDQLGRPMTGAIAELINTWEGTTLDGSRIKALVPRARRGPKSPK